ncbi:phage tail tape measure protein [Chitinimonas koreensis]|nr:phage tail tape measure protein [Chitinimonas koreensis]
MATTAAGAATGAAVLAPVKAYAEAEDAAKQLYIAMMRRGGMVAPEFARVTALADALGNRLPGTTADFQNMMTMLIRQGMTAKAVLGGLGEATAYLGVQLKMAPADAAEFAAKMQDATRTTEADMMRLMDAIQRTYYLGVDPSNMLQGFSKVSPALRTLRMEGLKAVNALAPMLVMFDQAGMKGEAGGNALRKVLDLGLDREKREKANAALKASGVGINLDLSDGKGEFGGLDHMFAEFAKLRHLNRETLIAALKTQFGDDAETQQVLSILIDKGRAGYLDTLDRMQAQADLQTRVAEQLGTLRNLWDAATGTMTNTLVRFGEAIAPELKAATEWIGDAAEAVGAFAKEHPVLTNAVMKTVAILAVLLTVMGALTLGLAAMMGPMLVVRAGLGLLGIQFGGTLRLAGSVAGMMGRTLPAVLGKLGGRLGQLAPALAGYWRAADPATAGRSTLQFAKTLRERIPAAAGAAAQSVRRWAGMLSGTAATELTVAEVGVRRYTARVWQAVQAQRAAMAARWTGGRQYLATRGIGGMAADAGRGGLNLAKGLALAPITAATSAMRLLGQVVLFVGRAALMNPIGLGITAIAVAALLVVKYWEPIRAWFGGFWQGLREGLAPIGELFGRAFGVIAPILAPLRPVWDWLLGALADAWNWASQLFEPFHATQQGLEAATASGRGFGRWLGSLITITTELLAAFATLPLRFVEIGVQLMQGLVDGITRALGTVKAAIVNAGDQTIGWFKERLGIHSPSRVFASLGGHTMDGLAIGLDRGSQAPLAAMLALTRQLTQPIVGAVALGTSVAAPAGQVAVDPLAALGRITIDHRPPLAASRPAAAEAGPALVIQELHVHAAPGMDAQQLARLVADEIARQTRATQATRRGRLADGD